MVHVSVMFSNFSPPSRPPFLAAHFLQSQPSKHACISLLYVHGRSNIIDVILLRNVIGSIIEHSSKRLTAKL